MIDSDGSGMIFLICQIYKYKKRHCVGYDTIAVTIYTQTIRYEIN